MTQQEKIKILEEAYKLLGPLFNNKQFLCHALSKAINPERLHFIDQKWIEENLPELWEQKKDSAGNVWFAKDDSRTTGLKKRKEAIKKAIALCQQKKNTTGS